MHEERTTQSDYDMMIFVPWFLCGRKRSVFAGTYLNALPDKTPLCIYGGSPRKVDMLDPLLTNRKCKYAEKRDIPYTPGNRLK